MIFTLILNLENLQEALYTAANKELHSLQQYEKRCNSKTGFNINTEVEKEHRTRSLKFKHFVSTIKCQVKNLSNKYNEFITLFLKALSSSSDMNLQLLSVRLNFNDFYQITWQDSPFDRAFESDSANGRIPPAVNDTNDLMYSFIENVSIDSTRSTPVTCNYGSINRLLNDEKMGKPKKNGNIWCCIGWEMGLRCDIYVRGVIFQNVSLIRGFRNIIFIFPLFV